MALRSPSLQPQSSIPVGENFVTSREDLKRAKRVVVKAGTSLNVEGGYPALKRIASIAEQIHALRRDGREVIFVASGAIGFGRNVMRHQEVLNSSALDRLHSDPNGQPNLPRAAYACAGQASMQNLYQTLFGQLNLNVAELLLTKFDFETEDRTQNIAISINAMLSLGIIPIVNENDAVSNCYDKAPGDVFYDNDGLAALVASNCGADLMVLLTDVEGLYDQPPSEKSAKLISTYRSNSIEFGPVSKFGRGGMKAKVEAALRAVQTGVPAVVITSGRRDGALLEVLNGGRTGTLVVSHPEKVENENDGEDDAAIEEKARATKAGGLALMNLSSEERTSMMLAIADALEERQEQIFQANEIDVAAAKANNVDQHLQNRLKLTKDKMASVIDGIRQLTKMDEPLGRLLSKTQISEEVELQKLTTAIGTVLIIFESRPDCLPQIAALCLRTGNGLLLKGGKEAEHSNKILHSIITTTIERHTQGRVLKSVIGLVSGRSEIKKLLQLNQHIDLVVPRGSNALVSYIQSSTVIPVLGHADGVCHIYVDASAKISEAIRVIIDAKTSYPSACNAVETLLIDHAVVEARGHEDLLRSLRKAGVKVLGGPRAIDEGILDNPCEDLHMEYGDLRLTVEVVSGVTEAALHINQYGSHHTDCILSNDAAAVKTFKGMVDSACVFHNVSTRMADGYRFGLGAEVGISTSRIHARGPVGVDGLLTSKWIMYDTREGTCTTVDDFKTGASKFVHKQLV